MHELQLRGLIESVPSGALPRRRFIERLVGLGLTAPMAAMLPAEAGLAQDQAVAYKPTRRGGGGVLKFMAWQGATMLNPRFAIRTKDLQASRLFYETLAYFDAEGSLSVVQPSRVPAISSGR